MPLKESRGNMYDWVTHTHTHLGGECSHKCSYCYVGRSRFGRAARYTGEPRMIWSELKVIYGKGKTIFVEHMNDLFSTGIINNWIELILGHCRDFSKNQYVFQTKNPERASWFDTFPPKTLIGTTIETDFDDNLSEHAPSAHSRFTGISALKNRGYKTFITIEPIMDFSSIDFAQSIIEAKPDFINIGADSKNCKLNEPTKEKLSQFIQDLQTGGIVIKEKHNLKRLLES